MKRITLALIVIVLTLAAAPVQAQEPEPPTLDEINAVRAAVVERRNSFPLNFHHMLKLREPGETVFLEGDCTSVIWQDLVAVAEAESSIYLDDVLISYSPLQIVEDWKEGYIEFAIENTYTRWLLEEGECFRYSWIQYPDEVVLTQEMLDAMTTYEPAEVIPPADHESLRYGLPNDQEMIETYHTILATSRDWVPDEIFPLDDYEAAMTIDLQLSDEGYRSILGDVALKIGTNMVLWTPIYGTGNWARFSLLPFAVTLYERAEPLLPELLEKVPEDNSHFSELVGFGLTVTNPEPLGLAHMTVNLNVFDCVRYNFELDTLTITGAATFTGGGYMWCESSAEKAYVWVNTPSGATHHFQIEKDGSMSDVREVR